MKRLLLAAALLLSARTASAVGAFVSTADGAVVSDVGVAIILRDGNHTSLTIAGDYKGPPADFALILPVPASVQKADVSALGPMLMMKLEALTAPKLVEYWERDPCGPDALGAKLPGHMKTDPRLEVRQTPINISAPGRFEVGEYDVEFVEPKTGEEFEAWLYKNKYSVPVGAAAVYAPAIREKQKFLVARVAAAKLNGQGGVGILSPLRVVFDSPEVRLPLLLGAQNFGARHDLTIYTVARERYEAANYPNAFVPTNLVLKDEARAKFSAFYARLFDSTLGKGTTIVTEYAGSPHSCEFCLQPSVTMDPEDVASLGGDVIFAEKGRTAGTVMLSNVLAEDVKLRDGLAKVVQANYRYLRGCAEQSFKLDKTLDGDVTVTVTTNAGGTVDSAVATVTSGHLPARATTCMEEIAKTFTFAPVAGTGKYVVHLASGPALNIPPLTLTRLHARYPAGSIKSDLVLRPVGAISGGREDIKADGSLELGTKPATGISSFQARYVLRYPWTSPITCAAPKRGVYWGERGQTPQIGQAHSLAMLPRGGDLSLAQLVSKGLPNAVALDQVAASNAATIQGPTSPTPPAPSTSASAVPSASASAPAPSAPAPRTSCHCSTPGRGTTDGLLLLLAAAGLAVRARTRSR